MKTRLADLRNPLPCFDNRQLDNVGVTAEYNSFAEYAVADFVRYYPTPAPLFNSQPHPKSPSTPACHSFYITLL